MKKSSVIRSKSQAYTGDDESSFKQSFIDEIKRREKEDVLIPFEEIIRKFGISTKKSSKFNQ